MADGNISQMETLKGTEENAFYNLFDLHKRRIDRLKAKHHGNKQR
jgi:hypothetical protein